MRTGTVTETRTEFNGTFMELLRTGTEWLKMQRNGTVTKELRLCYVKLNCFFNKN